MAVTKTLITKPARIGDSWGGQSQVRDLFVVEMGPEDFKLIDRGREWNSPANQADYFAEKRKREIEGGYYWGHITGHSHLVSVLDEGWHDGARRIADLAEKMYDKIPVPVGPRRSIRWQEQGDEMDKNKVYAGQLDRAWRAMPRGRGVAPRVISIDVNVGHNAHVNADDLFWAGAAGVALTDALESVGYRVELYSTSCSVLPDEHAALSRIIAKRAHDPVSPATTAALVAMPATFRWYHLQSWCAAPTAVGSGYGRAANIADGLNHAVRNGVLEGSEVILHHVLSEKQAIESVEQALEQIGLSQDSGVGVMQ